MDKREEIIENLKRQGLAMFSSSPAITSNNDEVKTFEIEIDLN